MLVANGEAPGVVALVMALYAIYWRSSQNSGTFYGVVYWNEFHDYKAGAQEGSPRLFCSEGCGTPHKCTRTALFLGVAGLQAVGVTFSSGLWKGSSS